MSVDDSLLAKLNKNAQHGQQRQHRPGWEYNPAMPRIYLERRELGEDLRRLFDLLDGATRASAPPGEYTPPVDVIESAAAVEIVMDLPGVSREHLHIVLARGTLLVAGIKRAATCGHAEAAFHLAERA